MCSVLLQTSGPAAFTAQCGENVLRAPVSSQEGPAGTHQYQSVWCYQTGRVSNNLVISLSQWFPDLLNLHIADYLENDTETRPASVIVHHSPDHE